MGSSLGPVIDVIRPYINGPIKLSGRSNAVARCPFHNDRLPSFAVNIDNGLWLCYGCGQRGNLDRFLKLAGVDWQVAEKIVGPMREQLEHFRKVQAAKAKARFREDQYATPYPIPDAVLGLFDYMPTGLVNVGFEPKLLRKFEIGYDRSKDRIIFPIRDLYGSLAGVSGRATRKNEQPRYKIYKAGYRDDKGKRQVGDYGPGFDEAHPDYEFGKGRYIWNAHRVYPEIIDDDGSNSLIVVEGFKACLWMIQNGFPLSVALMGASASRTQLDLLMRMAGNPIILFLDNDAAGSHGMKAVGRHLSRVSHEVFVAKYPEWAAAPDDMNEQGLNSAIEGAVRWRVWVSSQTS